MAYLFLFKVNADGSQTVVAREVVNEHVGYDELIAFRDAKAKELPCGEWQVDAVSEASVRALFQNNDAYAGSQWAKWQALREGDVVTESLPGAFWSDHISSASECAVTPASVPEPTTTTTVGVPVTEPLVPLPTVTSTSTSQPAPIVPSGRELAVTGADSVTLVVLALILMVMGALTQVRGKKA